MATTTSSSTSGKTSRPFVAFAVVELWLIGRRTARRTFRGHRPLGILTRAAAATLFIFLTLSGLVDFVTVKNDFTIGVYGDEPQQEATDWIVRQTPRDATFLTDFDQLYQAPTMAGRRILLGYSPWAQTSGYDVDPRKQAIAAIYSATDRGTACNLLKQYKVNYVLLGPLELTSTRFKVNIDLFNDMTRKSCSAPARTSTRSTRPRSTARSGPPPGALTRRARPLA